VRQGAVVSARLSSSHAEWFAHTGAGTWGIRRGAWPWIMLRRREEERLNHVVCLRGRVDFGVGYAIKTSKPMVQTSQW